MSLGLRHLAWVRARFSGLCRATARLADGVVPLVPPPPCSPAFYPHLLCASPAQLVSSLPHAPPPVAPVGHGSSLQGPVVHCADLCPVPGVSESCAQFSALTTRSSVSSSPVLSERAGPAPQAGSRPRPASLCGWCPLGLATGLHSPSSSPTAQPCLQLPLFAFSVSGPSSFVGEMFCAGDGMVSLPVHVTWSHCPLVSSRQSFCFPVTCPSDFVRGAISGLSLPVPCPAKRPPRARHCPAAAWLHPGC